MKRHFDYEAKLYDRNQKNSDISSRILVLLVVDGEKTGNGNFFTISGFTAFFVDSCDTTNGFTDIKGRFIKYTVKSNTCD